MLSHEAFWIRDQFAALEHSILAKIDEGAKRDRLGTLPYPAHATNYSSWEKTMSGLESLIAAAEKLKSDKASLTTELAAQTARADKAEADAAALKKELEDHDAKAAAAVAELEAEIAAESMGPTPNRPSAPVSAPLSVVVASPTSSGMIAISVSPADASSASALLGDAITVGATVGISGPGIAAGTMLEGVDNGTLALSRPTTAGYDGDGTEELTLELTG